MKNVVLQDTLTFDTFSTEEVLKGALKFEQSKQTTQEFQKNELIDCKCRSNSRNNENKARTNHEYW